MDEKHENLFCSKLAATLKKCMKSLGHTQHYSNFKNESHICTFMVDPELCDRLHG